jgi:hypothetical protein
MGFSVLFSLVKHKFTQKSESSTIINPPPHSIFNDEIEVINGKIVVYKRVSKDFKTQENTKNETVWTIGSILTVPNWNTEQECGEGKFHACSRTYFCDEFRSTAGDIYIAIEVNKDDCHEFKNPQYPHKIAFKTGKVLYICDKNGEEIK